MMNISEQSHTSIASMLKEAVSRYITTDDNSVVTDIHLQPRQDSGELLIFNDEDEELARTIIDEWVDYDGDDFYKEVEPVLRAEVTVLKDEGELDKLCLMKPYSFVLVDEEKETISELLLIDDEDTLLLDDELLKGLDEELDAFLKDLLENKQGVVPFVCCQILIIWESALPFVRMNVCRRLILAGEEIRMPEESSSIVSIAGVRGWVVC